MERKRTMVSNGAFISSSILKEKVDNINKDIDIKYGKNINVFQRLYLMNETLVSDINNSQIPLELSMMDYGYN